MDLGFYSNLADRYSYSFTNRDEDFDGFVLRKNRPNGRGLVIAFPVDFGAELYTDVEISITRQAKNGQISIDEARQTLDQIYSWRKNVLRKLETFRIEDEQFEGSFYEETGGLRDLFYLSISDQRCAQRLVEELANVLDR